MLRVAEHAERTDTGRQRKGNEDAYFARSPLFAVADGMGGAQAGEVASAAAIEAIERGLPDGPGSPEERLASLVLDANERIIALAAEDQGRAGMGTTMTAAYLTEAEVAVAHVGDSRLYRLRGGELERLTEDHTLVAELERQGKITQEEAGRHPQRSIITRALGAEPDIQVDHHTWPARDGDVYLICSDGLMMFPEERIGEIVRNAPDLRSAARALVDAANAGGGRDNITVVLFRVEEVGAGRSAADQDTSTGMPAVAQPPAEVAEEPRRTEARQPRAPRTATARKRRSPWRRRVTATVIVTLLIIVPIVIGISIAIRSVYFVGTDNQGFVAVYQGLPYDLPAGIHLYREEFVSGVSAAALAPVRRDKLLDHKLRSQRDANDLVKQLELGELAR
ncbi:MAG TPA: Stp1/IreP family PP2C-type Ser/Thr phosphatase [Solirubrobacteraceae bacterium]|jgi:protein phosphatase|nr:Stp1/IreP family PP2C-type Ser/Thr phosphatase [Solirubrobacteraceae bacterium]